MVEDGGHNGEEVPARSEGDGFVRCPFCSYILPPGSVIGTGDEAPTKRRCEAKTCQWGVMHVRCGKPAVTVRPRPSGVGRLNAERWDVCQEHADFLDRLRSNVTKHKSLLDRLGGLR